MARQSHREINFSLVWMKPYLIEFQSLHYRLLVIDIQIDGLDKVLKHYRFSSLCDGNSANEGPTSSCLTERFILARDSHSPFHFAISLIQPFVCFLAIAINNPLIRSAGKCDRDKRWHRIERGKTAMMLCHHWLPALSWFSMIGLRVWSVPKDTSSAEMKINPDGAFIHSAAVALWCLANKRCCTHIASDSILIPISTELFRLSGIVAGASQLFCQCQWGSICFFQT